MSMKMTMAEFVGLEPCPFCGGEAEILTAESMHGGYLFGIMCNDCRSRGDVFDTEAEAIKAWNARAERTCNVSEGKDQKKGWWICSECDTPFDMIGALAIMNKKKPMYCPGCGAKVVEHERD